MVASIASARMTMTEQRKPRAGADSATRAAKAFLGVASIAGTLGGWAVLATKEPPPARPEPANDTPRPVTRAGTTTTAVSKSTPARSARAKRSRRVPITMTRSSR
jgi:hypothetical protein